MSYDNSGFIVVVVLALAFAVWLYQKGLKYMHNKYYDCPTKEEFNKNYDIILDKENERRKAILEEEENAYKVLFESLIEDALIKIVTFPNEFDVEIDKPYEYCRKLYDKILNRCEDTKYVEELLCEEMLDTLVQRLINNKNEIDSYNSDYLTTGSSMR